MSLYRRGRKYWTSFTIDGTSYRKSTGTSSKNEAKQRERELFAEARRGTLTAKRRGPSSLFPAIDDYLEFKRSRAKSQRTPELEEERLNVVKAHFKDVPLSSITPAAIEEYQRRRSASKVKNRTINMDVAALSRVLKRAGRWRQIADFVEMLPEANVPIGRALTGDERRRLVDATVSNPAWAHVHWATVLGLNTGMRKVEVTHLRRRDVDLLARTVRVCRSKNDSSLRRVPLSKEAVDALARMLQRLDQFGFTDPDHYLWFSCQWNRMDPTKPIKKWDTAWRAARKTAGLPGLRFHDLRHTYITELAEAGTPDQVIKSLVGHVSQQMLEHYTHIRMQAKRDAVDLVSQRRLEQDATATGEPHDTVTVQ